MIDPVVRRAGGTDAVELGMLEQEARAALVGTRGGDRWLEEHPAIGDRWAQVTASHAVFVALLDGGNSDDRPAVPVGYLVLAVDGDVARIDQVYVTPGAREVGFGDTLLEAATEAARSAGAAVLEGEALPGDRETKNLYERAGITARLITVSRRLN
jgi:GNAT superfamily N-acetyltransferase